MGAAHELDVFVDVLDAPPTLARILREFAALAAAPNADAAHVYNEGNRISSAIISLLGFLADDAMQPSG